MRNLIWIAMLMVMTAAGYNTAEAGRYTMMPAEDGGFIRLDTETGAMAFCRNTKGTWNCRLLKEKTTPLAEQNKRLKAENKKLKVELKQMESFVFPKKPPPSSKPGEPKPQFQLPTEQDVDKALTYMQKIIRKFKDKMEELEKQNRKPSPPSTPL